MVIHAALVRAWMARICRRWRRKRGQPNYYGESPKWMFLVRSGANSLLDNDQAFLWTAAGGSAFPGRDRRRKVLRAKCPSDLALERQTRVKQAICYPHAKYVASACFREQHIFENMSIFWWAHRGSNLGPENVYVGQFVGKQIPDLKRN